MGKMPRRVRKSYNMGKQVGYVDGYLDGYEKGLRDGNPFAKFAESVTALGEKVSRLLDDPEIAKQVAKELERKKIAEEERRDAEREAWEEAMRLDDNEDTLKWKGTH